MASRTLRVLCLGLVVSSLAFGWVAHTRSQLPYNSEGRYFDAESATVYTDNAVLAYGSIAITSLILSGALLALSRRR